MILVSTILIWFSGMPNLVVKDKISFILRRT